MTTDLTMTTADNTQKQQEESTEQIIRELRRSGPLGPTVNGLMLAAARRLEQQEWDLVETLRERHKTVSNLIDQRDAACSELAKANQRTITPRPEPTQLEIAAMFMAGSWAGNDSSLLYDEAWAMAGALIAISKK